MSVLKESSYHLRYVPVIRHCVDVHYCNTGKISDKYHRRRDKVRHYTFVGNSNLVGCTRINTCDLRHKIGDDTHQCCKLNKWPPRQQREVSIESMLIIQYNAYCL
jgi:hypothetical protein